MTFRGSFHFASVSELDAALAAIQQVIDGEEGDMTALALRRRGCELRVDVETTCDRTGYLAYETIVETLATFADAGEVTGEIADTITEYAAVVDQPAASVLASVPVLLAISSLSGISELGIA